MIEAGQRSGTDRDVVLREGQRTTSAMKFLWPRWNEWPSWGLIFLVRVYQGTLSPLLGPCCRFEPSCSNYMIQAVRKYGFWKGMFKGAWRIVRCNPFCAGGYDPP